MNTLDDLFYLCLKIILRNQKNKILILKMHKNSETFWELPGGRIQFGETPEQGLRRELVEETGITQINDLCHLDLYLSSYRVQTNFNISAGVLFSLYAGVTSTDNVTLSGDHIDFAWVTEDEVINLLGNAYGPKIAEYVYQILK